MVKLLSSLQGPVSAQIVAPGKLHQRQRDQMLVLMQQYYRNVHAHKFFEDLQGKDRVIILVERATREIVGFSTLLYLQLQYEGKPARGVFSGDTIMHRRYWGSHHLQTAFAKHLVGLKARVFPEKLFWFLISKGYKTYLLMTNNFQEHWPRHDRHVPSAMKELMDQVYQQLYPERYEASTGLIRNLHGDYALKNGVAAPSEALVQQNQNVAYFIDHNPRWQEGVELACVAEMRLQVLTLRVRKLMRDQRRRLMPLGKEAVRYGG